MTMRISGKLGAKGDIGFFIGYLLLPVLTELECMYFWTNQFRTRILTYALSTITSQNPTECELDLWFKAMHDDYIWSNRKLAPRTAPVLQDLKNPFAPPSTSAAESLSSQYVDPANMHTFYQPYQHDYQWTKDHPLEQVIGEPS
ncbi:hypothetical protein Tco_1266400 [Tanacetum coccineum]